MLIVLFINKLITFSCLPRVSLLRCCYFFTQHHMTRALFAIINSNICISLETWLWTFKIKSFIQNAQINHFIPKRCISWHLSIKTSLRIITGKFYLHITIFLKFASCRMRISWERYTLNHQAHIMPVNWQMHPNHWEQ